MSFNIDRENKGRYNVIYVCKDNDINIEGRYDQVRYLRTK